MIYHIFNTMKKILFIMLTALVSINAYSANSQGNEYNDNQSEISNRPQCRASLSESHVEVYERYDNTYLTGPSSVIINCPQEEDKYFMVYAYNGRTLLGSKSVRVPAGLTESLYFQIHFSLGKDEPVPSRVTLKVGN